MAMALMVAIAAKNARAEGDPAPDTLPPQVSIADEALLRQMFASHTMYGFYPPPYAGKWAEYYCPTGRTAFVYEDKLMEGRWWVEAGAVCFSYDPPGHDQKQCYDVMRTETKVLKLHARVVGSSDFVDDVVIEDILPGDPFHMAKLIGAGCSDLSS
ncbi:MAG: hypothetical protein IPK59_22585 [Rhodospirillaceae bacterium]|nr:hypothetical protein [Rhodospirillaceae bacterium]